MTNNTEASASEVSGRARYAMLALAVGLFATISATAMPSVALPVLSRSLHADPASSVWIVALFQIGSAMALLPAATVAEIRGVRPVMIGGLLIFTVTSVVCALCHDLLSLSIARLLQGLAGAGVMTVTGILVREYLPPHLRGRGLGLAAFATASAGAIAPSLGAWLAASASWQSIFVLNAAFGLVSLVIAWPSLRPRQRSTRHFPAADALRTSMTIGLLLLGLFGVAQGSAATFFVLLLGGIAMAAITFRQRNHAVDPVLPIDLLLLGDLGRAYALSVIFYCAHLMTFVALPFLLTYRLDEPAASIGILMMPMSLFGALGAPVAARLAERLPPTKVALSGLCILVIGICALAFLPRHAGWIDIMWRMALTGVGVGLFQTPNFNVIISSAPPARSGSAGGLQATTRLVGQAAGSALGGLCLHLCGSASMVPLVAAGLIASVGVVLGVAIRPMRQMATVEIATT